MQWFSLHFLFYFLFFKRLYFLFQKEEKRFMPCSFWFLLSVLIYEHFATEKARPAIFLFHFSLF